MGSGASTQAAAAAKAAPESDLQVAVASLSQELAQKLRVALDAVEASTEQLSVADERGELLPTAQTVLALKDSYQEIDGTRFADVLRRGCMAVVKSSYFKRCMERGEPFQDRAQVPKEYIFTGEEVITKWKELGNGFLTVISYGWLSKTHPDPELYHLKRLVHILTKLQEFFVQWGVTAEIKEVGVILDFCSLWQNTSTVEGEDSRSEEKKAEFDEALQCINTPYAHQEVTAIKLLETPTTEPRAYDDRGWTLFESKLIDGKARGSICEANAVNVLALAKEIDTEQDAYPFIVDGLRKGRHPPLTPARFEGELALRQRRADERGVKLFTCGKDQPFIIKKYRTSYKELAKASVLSFPSSGWTGVQMEELVQALPDFTMLTKIDISNNAIGDEGANTLAKAMERNEANTKLLNLAWNGIGDAGAIALAKALEKNESITELDLQYNDAIGDEGRSALSKAQMRKGRTILF